MILEEYISGETLDEKLRRYGTMPPELVGNYAQQLLEVLEQIHAQGIVHRDISPKNILISTDGVVKLLDFDISRQWKMNRNADTTILGTVGFASPEQYGFLQTDATADIYAVGVLMNVMLEGVLPNVRLTGKKPFQGIIKKCIEIDPVNSGWHLNRRDKCPRGSRRFFRASGPELSGKRYWQFLFICF